MSARPKASTKEKALENRQSILEAAEMAFAAKGFEGANMRQIAESAGVNKYMLYYHFESKELLFQQVLAANLQPAFAHLYAILSQPLSLENAVAEIYKFYAQLFAEKGDRLRSFMAREIAIGAPHVRPLLKQLTPRLLELWEPKLSQYLGVTALSERRVRQLVGSIMIGVIASFLMQPLFEELMLSAGMSLHDEDMQEHNIQFILGGIRARLTQFVT